jgi:hypothetical protein
MRKLFKENEFDKISMELLNKIYPTEALNSYFLLGVAQTLHAFTDIANRYINGGYGEHLDAADLKKLIGEYISGNKEVKEMYERLRKEGVKTDFEKFQDTL